MLQGIFKVLFLALGRGLIHLGYGKKAMDARKRMELNGADIFLALLFSFGIIGWLVCLILVISGAAAKDTLLCIIIAIAIPVLYILWCIHARKKGKGIITEDEKREQERLEKARLERERRDQEYQEKLRLEREEQKRLEEEKKEQLRELLKQNAGIAGDLSSFAAAIQDCSRVKEILMLWESLQTEDNDLSRTITQKLEAAAKMERMYGSNPKELKALVADIQGLICGATTQKA